MSKVITKNYIKISKNEYSKLKSLEKNFKTFWSYFSYLQDIKEARRDVKNKKTVFQEKLFKELGI